MNSSHAVQRIAAVVAACIVLATAGPLGADTRKPHPRPRAAGGSELSLDHARPGDVARRPHAVTAEDVTVLHAWDFDPGCDSEGWVSVDRTEQTGTFFHVDDFAGLGGGDFGRLTAIEGAQSMWCGLRPGQTDPALCSYALLPGYGNAWDQLLMTADCLAVTGDVGVDYLIAWDIEPIYDWATLQYDRCDDDWVDLEGGPGVWEAVGSGAYSSEILDAMHAGDIRLRFRFQSDASWSDEDGLWDTDGAVILDSLTVRDAGGVVLTTETFEAEPVGDTFSASGNWIAAPAPAYGSYGAVMEGSGILQEDACGGNLTCMWGFFSGSTANYSCGGFPGQVAVPFGNERGQYIDNEIWSPWVPLSGATSAVELAFDVYKDLPLDNLVFYTWAVRTRDAGGCPGPWLDRDYVYYDRYFADVNSKRWYRHVEYIGDLIAAGATEIQVALGVVDECDRWCDLYGNGNCHSHSPLFDNVELRRIDDIQPQWLVRDMDLFQDTFAADGTTTGTARVDAAIDVQIGFLAQVRPGDSTVVSVFDAENGLASDPYTGTGPAVYTYVSVWNGIDPYAGADISDDETRWPVVDSLTHDGRTWFCVRMDTVYGEDGVEPNQFCVDLNDSLFVPGDTICFFFAADGAAPGGQTTYWSPFTGTTASMADVLAQPDECTILPAAGWKRGGYILYVDGFSGRGAQPFFDTAFRSMGIFETVDRFDVRGPEQLSSNRPGARVSNVAQQLLGPGGPYDNGYHVVIWNTGDLASGTIGNGSYSEYSDDAGMLVEFLDGLDWGGLFLTGDNIAEDWRVGSALTLRETYIGHGLVNGDHADVTSIRPRVIGEAGSPFDHGTSVDTALVWNQCPGQSDFDVLAPVYPAEQTLRYQNAPPGSGAGVGQWTSTAGGDVYVELWGFSYHNIRDEDHNGSTDRFHLLHDVLRQFDPSLPPPTAAATTPVNRLAQNIPNPFNPVTAIEFTIKERAPVTLRVYNVRGQLVKTLVNDTRAPGIAHRIEWDGHNDTGQSVASGVYFYRLVTKGFTQTKKMVLLK